MRKIVSFIGRNRWTCFMLAFVASFYIFIYAFHLSEKSHQEGLQQLSQGAEQPARPQPEKRLSIDELKAKEEAFRQNLQSHPRLMSLLSLGAAMVLLLGLSLNLYIFARRLQGLPALQPSGPPLPPVAWGSADIAQMFVLLFFVEAALISVELVVAYATGRETLNKDFMLMMNSLLRDILVAVFVVVLVAKKYRAKLSDMGLSMQRFWANLRIGFVSYLTIIPGFIAVLVVTGIVSKLFSYEPPPQPVVEIYLNENKHPHLLLFTLFVALVGPLIEEIFFRGFAYQAFRTRFGVTRAMLLSAFVFAALHLNLVAFVPIFLLGIALSYLYERTGSLVAPMTVHMLHNFLMVCFTLFYKAYSG